MAASTLDPDNIPESDRQLGKGHGADALGPSDISDSGSDVQPGLHAVDEEMLPLDRGTNEDSDSHVLGVSSDSDDSGGTGDSSTAGRNADVELAGDIGIDRIDQIGERELDDELDLDPDESAVDRRPLARRAGSPQQQKR